jgi:prevent-host-death family protein
VYDPPLEIIQRCKLRPLHVNIGKAKKQSEALVERAAAGEEIVIGRRGKPIATLGPIVEAKEPRKPGSLAGQIWMAADFDEPLPEFEKLFYGEDEGDDLRGGSDSQRR